MEMTIGAVSIFLQAAWTAETSSDPEGWSQTNPAWGQCAVSACLAQDILGGELLWTEAVLPDGKECSHYFNILPDGTVLDFTRSQFAKGTKLGAGGQRTGEKATTREYVLDAKKYPETVKRYNKLRENFAREAALGLADLPQWKAPTSAKLGKKKATGPEMGMGR